MKVADDLVVGIEYVLKNKEGQVLDSNEGTSPLFYIQGMGQIVPGLENAMDGKVAGDSFSIEIPAEEAYGEFDGELIQHIPRKELAELEPIEEGMEIEIEGEEGLEVVVVTGVEETEVTVDGNHPLAGQDLHFAVKVTEVRMATPEELEHGHVHGEGEDHH